jgi:hypothetical protein
MESEATVITRAEILAKRTPRGGWTKAQLAEWGIGWPPPRGFIEKLTGEAPAPKISAALRYAVLKRDGGRCVLCGRSAKGGAIMHVDHIFPASIHIEPPSLDSCQTLCDLCNGGKGNRDETNWHAA